MMMLCESWQLHKAKYFLDPMMVPLVCGETDCSSGCHDQLVEICL